MIDKKYSVILFGSSFFILILSMYLYKLGYSFISILYLLLFLTSICHWYKPEYGIKRNLDISMVVITTCASLTYFYHDIGYNLIVLYTLLLFAGSYHFQKLNYMYISTILHSNIHLTCLIGNAYYYKNLS
jgi:hypothetical protein